MKPQTPVYGRFTLCVEGRVVVNFGFVPKVMLLSAHSQLKLQ
jgi:hypothetical protein